MSDWPSLAGRMKPLSEMKDHRLLILFWANKEPCLNHPAYKDRSPDEWHDLFLEEIRQRGLDENDRPGFDDRFKEKMR